MNRLNLANKLVLHVVFSLLLAASFVLPDYFYGWLRPNYQAEFGLKPFSGFWIVAALLIGIRRKWVFLAFLLFIATLQLSQFLHFSYFGSLISPHEVIFLFNEWDEIWLTLAAVMPYMAPPSIIVGGFSILAYLLWKKSHPITLRIPFAAVMFLLLLSILPYRAYQSPKSQGFYPNPTAYSVSNTLYAVSFFVGRSLSMDKDPEQRTFQPYRVAQAPVKEQPTIVIVMGESLTHKHMSLFGYGRETTPELDRLKDDPNFVYHKAIAGGVSTKVSLPAFFNVQREPGNVAHLMRYESNLLKMAKERGYRTYYISAQTSNLSTYAGTEFADEFITQEDMEAQYEQIKDDVLLRQLERVDLSKPALIVLHQRNSHSPYDLSYPAAFEKYPIKGVSQHDYMVNAYDNSIRYTDNLLARIMANIKQRSLRPTYLFFTSDHGEMLGEQGKYGHTLLEADVIRVPFLFYAFHGDANGVVRQIRDLQAPTHYEIGRVIAGLLGFEVINPNEGVVGRFYANGPDLGGTMGCLPIEKNLQAEDGWQLASDSLCGNPGGKPHAD